MVIARGIAGARVLLGLLSLTKQQASETLENACEIAWPAAVGRMIKKTQSSWKLPLERFLRW